MGKITYDFQNERYIVTGASSGIGKQVCIDLVHHGAAVLALGRNEERLEGLRQLCPERIFTASLDVCDYSALEDSIKDFVQAHGKLNGGVHAAGIGGMTPLRFHDRAAARRIMDVSFWAGMELLRLITKSKYGHKGTSTVLFSSVCSRSHEKGKFAYAGAKAAVDAALGSAAKEICAERHRVNSVLPGWVKTPMTEAAQAGMGKGREIFQSRSLMGLGSPDAISKVVLFLLSDAARWITGTNIVVDGGCLS